MRVSIKRLKDIDTIKHYKGSPYNGVGFEKYKTSQLLSEVEFINGRKEGLQKSFYKKGSLKSEVGFINGLEEGLQKGFHETGELKSEVEFINGLKEGLQKLFRDTGELEYEVEFINDVQRVRRYFNFSDGDLVYRTEYNENGRAIKEHSYYTELSEGLTKELEKCHILNFEIHYVDGDKRKATGYHLSGRIKSELNWLNGQLEGLAAMYHENGNVKDESNYINGLQEGLAKKYYENGNVKEEFNYINGIQEGFKKYDENGNVKEESNQREAGYINVDYLMRLNKERHEKYQKEVYLPSAPELEVEESKVKYNYEKNASEFNDVKEILEFLKSDTEFKIRVNAFQDWSGFFQLKNDPTSDNVKHINLYHNYEEPVITVNEVDGKQVVTGDSDYDVKKQTYDDGFCVWANTIIDREFLIKLLTKYLSNDDNENEIYDFYQSLDLAEDPDTALQEFTSGYNRANKNSNISIDMNYGKGRGFGVNDISWEVVSEIKDAGIEIIFFD